jgi:hypothetical protein
LIDDTIRKTRVLAVERLLNAFYRRRYDFQDVSDLGDLVEAADYYLALPAVVSFVESNLLRSPLLLNQIPTEAPRFLVAARTLRSDILFREAFIHVVGKWGAEADRRQAFEETMGGALTDLVVKYHGKISEKLNSVFRCSIFHHQKYVYLPLSERAQNKMVREAVAGSINLEHSQSSKDDAAYCRKLHNAVLEPGADLVEAYRVKNHERNPRLILFANTLSIKQRRKSTGILGPSSRTISALKDVGFPENEEVSTTSCALISRKRIFLGTPNNLSGS